MWGLLRQGVNLTTTATVLNFTGSGVTATGTGASKTITITSGTGIALDNLSIGSPASASGSGSIAYNNATGVFTFTPPDLSTYLTSESDTLTSVLGRGATTTTTAVIPFYYANQAALPSASTYHGAIGHSHADGAMYFAHGGSWNKLANFSELPSLGSITFSGTTIDSSDSSGIVVTPAITMSSDLTVQNDLIVNNKIVAGVFENNGTGTPMIDSSSSIELKAQDQVKITSSALRLAHYTTATRPSAANGDIIYNSQTNKFQGYASGAWVDLH